MRTMRAILAALIGLAVTSPAFALDITACNQGVPAGATGVLQVDLDCSAEPGSTDGVWIERNGTLDLNGHTLVGPPRVPLPNGALRAAVRCRLGRVCSVNESGYACSRGRGRCTVTSNSGTGHVEGATGIFSERDLIVSHVAVSGGPIVSDGGRLTATDVSVSGGSLVAAKIVVQDVHVEGAPQSGVHAFKKVIGKNLTVTGSGDAGVQADRITLDGLVATGNGTNDYVGGGVFGRSCKLRNSTVSGNFIEEDDWLYPVDIFTTRRPRLVATTCDHSAIFDGEFPPTGTWDVCTLD